VSTTTILVAEQKSYKVALINIVFSYGILTFIISATSSNELLFDITRVSIVGSILATFLAFVDPVNRIAKWMMPKMFGTPDSVTWTLDAMNQMSLLKKGKVDLTPSTDRIQQWAKNSYYSPYLSGFRVKIVSETYFGIGLIIIGVGSFLPVQVAFASTLIRTLLIASAIVIFISLLFHYLELIEKAHIVAVFEMMITFGIPFENFEGCKSLLRTENWSEARSWILRELGLPLAPWHWITLEPKYGEMTNKIIELEKLFGHLEADETEKIRSKLRLLSADLTSIAYSVAEKVGVEKDQKGLLELATTFLDKGIIPRPLYEGIKILEELIQQTHSDEGLLHGRHLLMLGPEMKEELRKVAEKKPT